MGRPALSVVHGRWCRSYRRLFSGSDQWDIHPVEVDLSVQDADPSVKQEGEECCHTPHPITEALTVPKLRASGVWIRAYGYLNYI
jgi:hypothetical protein